MKFSLLQENLSKALSHLSRFTSGKVQLPILSHLLISSDSGRLKISATNLEFALSYWVGAKIESEGTFCVPARELTEFVSYLPSGKLDFELDANKLLKLQADKAQSTFTTTGTDDFPELLTLNSDLSFDLESELLRSTITQIAFAASTDDTRPVLTAIYCLFTSDKLTLVATDGFRLSLKEIKLVNPIQVPDDKPLIFLIPAKSLQEIAKIAKLNSNIRFGPTRSGNELIFQLEDSELSTRLIEGDYPDYQRIIPDSFSTKVYLNRQEFAQAIKLASVFAKESANVIKLSLKQNTLDLSSNAPQLGQNKATIDARIEGEPLDIAFNYKFISDYLSVAKGEEVIIELNESLTPALFRDQADPSLTHIIMPVRLQD